MKKQLVLLGGGHAHMLTLARLHLFTGQGVAVTVVQPSPYHYYSGMGPGLLGGAYRPERIRFATAAMVERAGGRFVLARAVRIDPVRHLVELAEPGGTISYDVLSCNVGSFIRVDCGIMTAGQNDTLFTVKPIEGLLRLQERIVTAGKTKAVTVGIIGGGSSAVEIAGNLVQLGRRNRLGRLHVQLFAGSGVLAGEPAKVGKLAATILARHGVEIIAHRIVRREGTGLVDSQGRVWPVDCAIAASGVAPSPLFRHSGLCCGPSGGLLVNGFLQSVQYPDIFGGGDCIDFAPRPLAKAGVMAVRQNPVLLHNLLASLQGTAPQRFYPGGGFLKIYNLGNGIGLFAKGGVIFSGRIAFMLKNAIDTRFMRTFQRQEVR